MKYIASITLLASMAYILPSQAHFYITVHNSLGQRSHVNMRQVGSPRTDICTYSHSEQASDIVHSATATVSSYNASGKDSGKTDATFQVSDKYEYYLDNAPCSFRVQQGYSFPWDTYWKITPNQSSSSAHPVSGGPHRACVMFCHVNKHSSDPCDGNIMHAHADGSNAVVSITMSNFDTPQPIVQVAPTMTQIPILTSDNKIFYRVKIHSGELNGYDYSSPMQVTPIGIVNDPIGGHFHVAFFPYTVYEDSTVKGMPFYVVPISTVHLNNTHNLYGPVSLNEDTEFLYEQKTPTEGVEGLPLSIVEAMASRINPKLATPFPEINEKPPAGHITLPEHPELLTKKEGFDLRTCQLVVENNQATVYANGLNQAPIGLRLIGCNAAPPEGILDRVYFRRDDGKPSPDVGPILTNRFVSKKEGGYSFMSHTRGPYVANLAVVQSLKKQNFKSTTAEDPSTTFYFSTTEVKQQRLEGQVCEKVVNEQTGEEEEPVCITSSPITATGISPEGDATHPGLQVVSATKDKIDFNHPIFKPFTGTQTAGEHAGPMWVDYDVMESFGLKMPLIYGIPNYSAPEVGPYFNGVTGNSITSTDENGVPSSAFQSATTLTLNIVDIYGNPFNKVVNKTN